MRDTVKPIRWTAIIRQKDMCSHNSEDDGDIKSPFHTRRQVLIET